MKSILFIALLFPVNEAFNIVNPFNKQASGKIDKLIGACPGEEKNVIGYFKNVRIRRTATGMQNLDYDIVFRSNMDTNLKSVWKIQKCKSKENPDSCMQIQTIRTSQVCKMFQSKDDVWSGLINCVTPKWECPFKKGTYVGRNCTYDSSNFNMFSLESSYWIFRVELYSAHSKRMQMCIIFEGGVITQY